MASVREAAAHGEVILLAVPWRAVPEVLPGFQYCFDLAMRSSFSLLIGRDSKGICLP